MKKEEESIHKETIAIVASILFLGLGIVAVWFSSAVVGIKTDGVLLSMLFVPILVYVIFSGRLREIRGPGGLAAKFAEAAESKVEPVVQSVAAESSSMASLVDDVEVIRKEGLPALERSVHRLDESKPFVLTMTVGRRGYYDYGTLRTYVDTLRKYLDFKFMVLLDSEERFVAYVQSWALKETLLSEALGRQFVAAVNQGEARELKRYPGVATTTIGTRTTDLEALQEMDARNLDALLVIDSDRRLKGIVQREQVLTKLVLAMLT